MDRLEELRRLIHQEQQSAKKYTVPTAFVTFKCAAWHLLGTVDTAQRQLNATRLATRIHGLSNIVPQTAGDCAAGTAQQLEG